MIDFRYHVVSLVSVFLALAVGIVLGAGPLKDPARNFLVSQLTQENNSLKADRTAALAQVQRRDDFLDAVSPALTAEQLGGRTVVLVLMPGADTSGLGTLTAALKSAGATVTGRITIKGAWSDPAQRTFRDQLATQLQAALPAGTAVSSGSDQVLSALLARASVTAELVSAGSADSQGKTILEALKDGNLIGVGGSLVGRATQALLVAAPVQGDVPTTPSPSGSGGLDSQVVLAEALDAGSTGAVAEGPPSAAGQGGLLAAIRGDDAAAAKVSTVDTGGTPMGDIATVLALRQQLKGEAGKYGFGSGADSPLPPLPKAA
jgi:Copper transport outer membrane protein, MctB